jgi:hypothetical protein
MATTGNNTNVQAAAGRLLARFRDTVCVKYAAEAEQKAKENAPWTDRTSDARKHLKGIVLYDEEVKLDTYKQEGNKTVKSGSITIDGKGCIGIALVHRVEYGKYLETANDGKYAILKPTIEGLRADFFANVREFFGDKK